MDITSGEMIIRLSHAEIDFDPCPAEHARMEMRAARGLVTCPMADSSRGTPRYADTAHGYTARRRLKHRRCFGFLLSGHRVSAWISARDHLNRSRGIDVNRGIDYQ